jgi:hypothetical protein
MARNLLAALRSEERAAWERASSANQPASYQEYLRRYPNGEHASAARNRVEEQQTALRRPSVPVVSPPALPPPDDGRVVLSVLGQYQKAYEDRKVEELATVWPSMTSRQIGSLRKFFKDAEQVSLTYDLMGQPEVNENEATIRFMQSLNYTIHGKTLGPDSAKVIMHLRKLTSAQGAQAKWVIESIR